MQLLLTDFRSAYAACQLRKGAMSNSLRKVDKSSRRTTTENESMTSAAVAPAVPTMDLAPLRGAPQGRSIEAVLPEDIYMDQLVHKLQLLNYERDFCRRKKPYRKTLTPTYFAAQQSGQAGNEQFFYFTSIAAWLIQLCGLTIPTPKEFDDPNAILQNLMQGLHSLGFAPPSYPPTKLSAGCGREVCALLDGLVDVTLERRGVTISRPVYQADRKDKELAEEGAEDDDRADIATLAAEQAEVSSDDQDAALPWGRTGELATSPAAQAAAAEAAANKQVLVSLVDPMQWKLEVERVAPKLRITIAADLRDWRQHLAAAHGGADLLAASWPETKAVLQKLGAEVAASLEKIEGRERQLNGQFDGLMEQYQGSRQQLLAAQEKYNRCTELISERNNELHRLANALEDVKQQLDSRGSNLSDASPLVRLKSATANLKTELRQMELRIGVVSHQVVNLSLRDKQAALADAVKQQLRQQNAPGSVK